MKPGKSDVVAELVRHPFVTKLETLGALPQADHRLIARMLNDVRTFESREDIIAEGDNPNNVHLMVEGWACRYSIVGDGRRQITAFLAPGDFCDLHITALKYMDHSIGTLGPARVAFIPKALMHEVAERPALTRALWWAGLVDEAVLRAWIVNLGRRDALQRVAHLICELHARLQHVGLGRVDGLELPFTQEDLSDAVGLTSVHINRVLRALREGGLMTFSHKAVGIDDIAALRRVAGFDAHYLHLAE